MSKTSNFIDINGVRYNARTGEYVAHLYAPAPKPHNHKPHLKSTIKKPTMSDVVRQPGQHNAAHKPKTSQTLMRHAVKKPQPSKRVVSESLVRHPVADIALKKSVKAIDNRRLSKAQAIPQSKLIRHFAPITSDTQVSVSVARPLLSPTAAVVPSRPVSRSRPVHQSKPRTTADLLEQALNNATSHQQPKHHIKKRRSHRSKAAVATAAFLLMVGFMGYQQLPDLRLHHAASRAGIAASLPGYSPAGYSLAKLNYSPGIVASQFHSNSDQRMYAVIEKASSWDSQALLENFVLKTDKNYQTTQVGGRTVFLYNNGQATWVDGGIWYQIQNDGSLSQSQLNQLVASL